MPAYTVIGGAALSRKEVSAAKGQKAFFAAEGRKGKSKMNSSGKKEAPKGKNFRLAGRLQSNAMVYRAFRTFLQAAIGVFMAGLVEYLSGKFTGQTPGKVFLYFIVTAVAAGLSAVMNRGEAAAKQGSPEEPETILQQVAETFLQTVENREENAPEEKEAPESGQAQENKESEENSNGGD